MELITNYDDTTYLRRLVKRALRVARSKDQTRRLLNNPLLQVATFSGPTSGGKRSIGWELGSRGVNADFRTEAKLPLTTETSKQYHI